MRLEKKTYTRVELAEIFNLDIKDTKHFKRNLTQKLSNLGYSYNYSSKAVEITDCPQTSLDKLQEMMLAQYGMDIRVEVFPFAAYLYYLLVYEDFLSMPWGERVKALEEDFGIEVSDRTLRRWTQKLIELNIIAKDPNTRTYWGTMTVGGDKERFLVSGDPEEEQRMEEYVAERTSLLKTMNWTAASKTLWLKYGICYYSCPSLELNALGTEELYNLILSIMEED